LPSCCGHRVLLKLHYVDFFSRPGFRFSSLLDDRTGLLPARRLRFFLHFCISFFVFRCFSPSSPPVNCRFRSSPNFSIFAPPNHDFFDRHFFDSLRRRSEPFSCPSQFPRRVQTQDLPLARFSVLLLSPPPPPPLGFWAHGQSQHSIVESPFPVFIGATPFSDPTSSYLLLIAYRAIWHPHFRLSNLQPANVCDCLLFNSPPFPFSINQPPGALGFSPVGEAHSPPPWSCFLVFPGPFL